MDLSRHRAGPDRRRDRAARQDLVRFGLLAFALSWAWWVPLLLADTVVVAGRGWPTHLIGLTGPAIAAIVVAARGSGASGLGTLLRRCGRWRFDRRGYAIIGATALVGLVPALVSGSTDWSGFGRYSGAPQWGPATILVVLVVNGFGEEIGWRGFLWDRLRRTHCGRDAALIVWVVWGLWHLPLFWIVADFRDFGPTGALGWAVSLFFGAVFLGWFYELTDRSVLAVVVWHVVYNFAVATDATSDIGAAAVSVGVIVAGVAIMRNGALGPPRPT